ncbi:MAG: phage virion morphogenesis protein [Treponema sp.]|jgi:phage gpG-like protein|nr:phage virion morphogenesis protein [Treponema sp.]
MSVLETLDRIQAALQNPVRLETIGKMAAETIQGHLYDGKGFAPLAPATAAYRGRGRPLQDTGSLRGSITWNMVDDRTVSVGTAKPHAAIQNSGGVIRAKKNWLWIPGPGLRHINRTKDSGYSIRDVLNYFKSQGYRVYRRGRTIGYNGKRKIRNKDGKLEYEYHTLYYLKKSVEIPARNFFYLSREEINRIAEEAGIDLDQL